MLPVAAGEACVRLRSSRETRTCGLPGRSDIQDLRLLRSRTQASPAAMYGLAPTVYPLLKKLPPRCIYVSGLLEEAVVGFWPKLEELVACRLQSGLEGH